MKYIYILLTLSLLTSSCSKSLDDRQDNSSQNNLSSLRKPIIDGYTVNSLSQNSNEEPTINLDKKKQANTSPIGGRIGEPISWVYPDGNWQPVPANGNLIYFHQKYKSQMFTIPDNSMALNIYPGAILDGRSIEGIFDPKILQGISSGIRPVTLSTSMPVSPGVVAKTALPRPTSGIALYNAALTDLENQDPYNFGAASLQLELDSFTIYEELKTLYGYNKKIDLFLAGSNTIKKGENHFITARSAVKVKFFQQNFTIDVDTPNDYTQLFDPTNLNMNVATGGVTPVYVKSVTYGRMGIMVIESNYTSDKLYNAVYKQLGILKNIIGIGTSLTQEEKDILNSADIKVKYTGIGQDSDGTIKVNGLSGFIDILSANKTYSKQSPGIPVAFQLAYLDNNHGIVEAPFQINYGPYDKPYVRFEYENLETEKYSSQGIPLMIYKGKVFIKLYKDPLATTPALGHRFLSINYLHQYRARNLTADHWTAYDDYEHIIKTLKSTNFRSTSSSYYFMYASDISMSIQGPVPPRTPSNPRADLTGHTGYYYNEHFIEEGHAYHKLPTIGYPY